MINYELTELIIKSRRYDEIKRAKSLEIDGEYFTLGDIQEDSKDIKGLDEWLDERIKNRIEKECEKIGEEIRGGLIV